MELRPHRIIKRKNTKEIKVGNVSVGGMSLISVQSMTNTLTTNIKETIDQIHDLEEAGADIVRVSCPDEKSTKALKDIVKEVSVPIVADIHFHYKRAIEAATTKMAKILYSAFKKAKAPFLMLVEMVCIFSFPASCFITQRALKNIKIKPDIARAIGI